MATQVSQPRSAAAAYLQKCFWGAHEEVTDFCRTSRQRFSKEHHALPRGSRLLRNKRQDPSITAPAPG
eukprot:2979159-Prorocentrum_lima.AAC.1